LLSTMSNMNNHELSIFNHHL